MRGISFASAETSYPAFNIGGSRIGAKMTILLVLFSLPFAAVNADLPVFIALMMMVCMVLAFDDRPRPPRSLSQESQRWRA